MQAAYAPAYQIVHLILVNSRQHMLLHTRQYTSSLSPVGSFLVVLYHKLYTQSSAPEDGRNYRPKHVELIVWYAGAYFSPYQTVHLILVNCRQRMLLHTRQYTSYLSTAGSICFCIPESTPHPCHQQAAYAPSYQTVHLILVNSRQHMLLHTRQYTSSLSPAGSICSCIPESTPHACQQQAAPSVHYTTSCKHSLVLLRMGEIIARNMLN